jgi:hypothetical protein
LTADTTCGGSTPRTRSRKKPSTAADPGDKHSRATNCSCALAGAASRTLTPWVRAGGDINTPAKVALLGLTPTISPVGSRAAWRSPVALAADGCPSLVSPGAGLVPRPATRRRYPADNNHRRGRGGCRRGPHHSHNRHRHAVRHSQGCSARVALAPPTVVTMVWRWSFRPHTAATSAAHGNSAAPIGHLADAQDTIMRAYWLCSGSYPQAFKGAAWHRCRVYVARSALAQRCN